MAQQRNEAILQLIDQKLAAPPELLGKKEVACSRFHRVSDVPIAN
jgi:hypothetical protein